MATRNGSNECAQEWLKCFRHVFHANINFLSFFVSIVTGRRRSLSLKLRDTRVFTGRYLPVDRLENESTIYVTWHAQESGQKH